MTEYRHVIMLMRLPALIRDRSPRVRTVTWSSRARSLARSPTAGPPMHAAD